MLETGRGHPEKRPDRLLSLPARHPVVSPWGRTHLLRPSEVTWAGKPDWGRTPRLPPECWQAGAMDQVAQHPQAPRAPHLLCPAKLTVARGWSAAPDTQGTPQRGATAPPELPRWRWLSGCGRAIRSHGVGVTWWRWLWAGCVCPLLLEQAGAPGEPGFRPLPASAHAGTRLG